MLLILTQMIVFHMLKKLESFFLTNEVKDEKKIAILLTVLDTKAYTLLQNVIAPAKPAKKSYQHLVYVMKLYVDPKPIAIADRFQFHRCNQKEGETIVQYLTQLRKSTEHCEFRDNLEALRDRLVCGISSVPIQKRLLAEKDLTLQKTMEIAQGMKAATKQSSELHAPGGPVSASQDIQFTASTKPCYRCGGKGHPQEKFHFKSQKYNNCGKKGTLQKYVGRPKNNSARKFQPSHHLEKQNHQNNMLILWVRPHLIRQTVS